MPGIYLHFCNQSKIWVSLFWSLKYVSPIYTFFWHRPKPGPQPDTASYQVVTARRRCCSLGRASWPGRWPRSSLSSASSIIWAILWQGGRQCRPDTLDVLARRQVDPKAYFPWAKLNDTVIQVRTYGTWVELPDTTVKKLEALQLWFLRLLPRQGLGVPTASRAPWFRTKHSNYYGTLGNEVS